MSSLEDSTTPETPVSGSDAADAAPESHVNMPVPEGHILREIPSPADILDGSAVQGTAELRAEIREVILLPAVWTAAQPMLRPQGLHGSVQFDHKAVADLIFDNSEKLQTLQSASGLTMFSLWYHIAAVLKKLGYNIARGYIVSYNGDFDNDKAE